MDRDQNAAANLASLAFSSKEPASGGGLPGELARTNGVTMNQEGRKTAADREVRASSNVGGTMC